MGYTLLALRIDRQRSSTPVQVTSRRHRRVERVLVSSGLEDCSRGH